MSHTPENQGREAGDVVEFPENQTLSAQANAWVVKLDGDEPTAEDLQDFKVWVNQSDEHRIAFEEAVSFWDEMNVLTQVVLPRERVEPDTSAFSGWFQRRPVFSSAFVLVIALAAVLLTPFNNDPKVYQTTIGEQQTLTLSDGSTVILNTNSRLEVDYSSKLRSLKLTKGEAHFDVFHDKSRPFEVRAGKGLVRAVGTAFSVHVRRVDVEVIVTEGTVELDRAEPIDTNVTFTPSQTPESVLGDASTAEPVAFEPGLKVTAGNMMQYDRVMLDQVKLAVASEIEKQLSWQQGMLAFNGERLETVVEEVSRYTKLKIIIPERSTRDLKVGGLFKVGDTESLFEALRYGFNIHVKEISDDVVYLISSENR